MHVPIILVVSVFLARLLPLAGDQAGLAFVANLTPIVALTLCGAVFFRKGWMMVLPLFAFLISDFILNVAYETPLLAGHTLVALVVYGLILVGGLALRNLKKPTIPVIGGTIAGVVLFYLVSNSASFFFFPGYAKSFEGWIQCMTVGLPGFPPTWSFLVKALVSNTVFAAIFCRIFIPASLPQSESSPSLSAEQTRVVS
ncbi:MAG: hypothetical protein ACI9R3_002493 [Verrucomicrobiales bacterium]|jgi:hypothetical protein